MKAKYINPFTDEKAEIANYTEQERTEYQESLKIYRDMKGVIDTAYDEGKMEGIIEGKIEGKMEGIIEGELRKAMEIAKSLKNAGIAIDIIIQATGLSEDQIHQIKWWIFKFYISDIYNFAVKLAI